jgi:hypothetical protein
MLNRNHLHLSSNYVKPGEDYISFMKLNITIDLLSNIVIIILMGMITIMLVSYLIGPYVKERKVNDKNK